MDMAEAAEGLALPYLQQWLLEQACRQSPRNPEPMRRLARAYEQGRDLEKAITAWQGVRKLAPSDPEPARKISALSVKDTITRGNYDAT
jgi:cytochrome c-type biogenesis protein CcmH/NrfG